MASYSTIPKDEADPLVAAAPKSASPKFKAAALMLCLASAVAGYHAPAAFKYLSFGATGGGNLPSSGSPIQMQECEWIDNSGGQRQQIIIPGYGASSGTYEGYLDYVLTQKLCIGPLTGKLSNNKAVAVKSDTCNTKYTVKYL